MQEIMDLAQTIHWPLGTLLDLEHGDRAWMHAAVTGQPTSNPDAPRHE